jgi:predicted MFS family arabinose efflux permease
LASDDDTPTSPGVDRPVAWFALITIATFAPVTSSLLPAIVGSLVDYRHFTAASAARVGSLYSVAGMLAGVVGFFWIRRVDRRLVLVTSILLGLVADLSAVWLHQFSTVAAGRLVSGFAASTIMIVVNATIARSLHSQRLFGIVVTTQSLLAAALFFALPRLSWAAPQVFSILAVCWALLLPFGLFVPNVPQGSSSLGRVTHGGRLTRPSVVLLTVAFLCFYIATGIIWTYLYLIGEWHGIARTDVGSAISLGMLFAIPGSFFVALLGERRRGSLPLIVALAANVVFTAILLMAIGKAGFALASCGTSLLFTFALALFLTLLGDEDPDGRLLSIGNMVIFCGLALGPLLFRPSTGGGYLVPLVAAVAFFTASPTLLFVRHIVGTRRLTTPASQAAALSEPLWPFTGNHA